MLNENWPAESPNQVSNRSVRFALKTSAVSRAGRYDGENWMSAIAV